MRVLIVHGYLLHGTGSNVYTASVAAALVGLGHEVAVVCQDREPEELAFVDAVGTWDGGALDVAVRRDPVRCTVYRPDIGGLLPVYVADRYEGFDARAFDELDDAQLARYLDANVAAVTEVVERFEPDVALAGHLVMAPVVLARATGGRLPYAVKIHGSALEYTVKPDPDRFLPYAREGLEHARGVLVGSRHTAESLWAALEDDSVVARTRLGPPGVDIEAFGPREPAAAAAGLEHLAGELAAAPPPVDDGSSFARDPGAADAVARLDPAAGPLVGFVGKLIISKGVDLLLAAWPLVLAHAPGATLVMVGFGAYRDGAGALVRALAGGDLDAVRDLAHQGRAVEGGPRAPLAHMLAFLDRLEGDDGSRAAYLDAAGALEDRVVFTGRLEHFELADLLPTLDAQVVPSTFPEAFGMVAAEAAACGALPVSAGHSGLAEVSAALADAIPAEARPWLSFPVGDDAVDELAARLVAWLDAPDDLRADTRAGLVRVARERYSWQGVARGVIDAAQGRLEGLPEPAPVDG